MPFFSYNMAMATLARNTAFMTVAAVGQKILSFAYFTFLARMLGAELTGKYFLALSFTTVFAVLTDAGLAPALSREVARSAAKARSYLATILGLKGFFMIGAYVLVVTSANLLGYQADTKQLIYLSGLTMLFDSIHLSFYATLRGKQILKYESVGMVGSQLLTLLIGTAALLTGAHLLWLIAAFTIASALNVLYSFTMLQREGVEVSVRWDWELGRKMLLIALPFGLAGIFTRVYSFADTIMLSKLMDEVAVGWYSIPNKISFAFQFLPLALVAGLYPRISEAFIKEKKKVSKLFEDAVRYLVVLVVPISVGIGVLANDIIYTLYTAEYDASILPLQILLASLVFAFLGYPVGAVLNGCNKQSTQTSIMGLAMIINVLGNFVMIPQWGVTGAAIAAFVGNAVLFFGGYFFLHTVTTVRHDVLWLIIGKGAISGAVMGALVWYALHYMSWPLTIPLGAVVYLVCIFSLKLVQREDLAHLKNRFG